MEAGTQVLVRRATIDDLDLLVPLFDAYRQFYGQPSDIPLAGSFLGERFRNSESIIFIALDSIGVDPVVPALGFTQLYPSFSSAAARRIFILNDLFVTSGSRRRGVGRLLLQAAAEFGTQAGAARLALSTALDNRHAQALYESSGWVRDRVFCTYSLPLSK